MKTILLFVFLVVSNLEVKPQEQNYYFTQASSVDIYGEVIYDWHKEQNTIVFNPGGTNDVIWWIQSDGAIISFYNPKKSTGYDESGYYYEEYEVSGWNTEFNEEEIVFIRRYTKNGLIILYFWDGEEMFYP